MYALDGYRSSASDAGSIPIEATSGGGVGAQAHLA
jgi:hypothetical protein